MHLKTVIFTLLLFLAGTLGRSQKVTLPFWGWVLWGCAISLALIGWLVVRSLVSRIVRRAVLSVPISKQLEERVGKLNIPVAEVHSSAAQIEAEIAAEIKFRPLTWLAVKAFRMQTSHFIGSILDHCRANDSAVFDERLFATWLHGKVAETIATTAAEIASGIWMIALVLLVAFGLYFGMHQFR
jgi:hypothetical protein